MLRYFVLFCVLLAEQKVIKKLRFAHSSNIQEKKEREKEH
jgi:hypothetical protein